MDKANSYSRNESDRHPWGSALRTISYTLFYLLHLGLCHVLEVDTVAFDDRPHLRLDDVVMVVAPQG